MADSRGRRPSTGGPRGRGPQRKFFYRKKFCLFCKEKELKIDYKDARALKSFITERGKIMPRRITGTCAKHQRKVCLAIKRARIIAILPFSSLNFQ